MAAQVGAVGSPRQPGRVAVHQRAGIAVSVVFPAPCQLRIRTSRCRLPASRRPRSSSRTPSCQRRSLTRSTSSTKARLCQERGESGGAHGSARPSATAAAGDAGAGRAAKNVQGRASEGLPAARAQLGEAAPISAARSPTPPESSTVCRGAPHAYARTVRAASSRSRTRSLSGVLRGWPGRESGSGT